MRIPTDEIPQADELGDVVKVVRAVGHGARTFQEIAAAIGKVNRQGRYYRRAAEILGMIQRVGPNDSTLSPKGRAFVRATGRRICEILTSAVLGAPLFQRVIPFLETKVPGGCSHEEFGEFIAGVTARTGPTMIPRRAQTVVSWLKAVGVLRLRGGRYRLVRRGFPSGSVQYDSVAEPLLPRTFALAEYSGAAAKASAARGYINRMVDQTKVERANRRHQALTDLVAQKVRQTGAVPRSNQLVDLAASIRGRPYIFEIKSTTRRNTHDQIRRGISQLYEYRYLQGAPEARLTLVIEKPVPQQLAWVVDYVVRDRRILLAWDGDMRTLHSPPTSRRHLRFLF